MNVVKVIIAPYRATAIVNDNGRAVFFTALTVKELFKILGGASEKE